jgi:hypothetical protein
MIANYLWYIARHKWFVFVECCKLGMPLRGVIHDWQKFLPFEWRPYAWSFYGPWSYNDRPSWLKYRFDRAWLHHIHKGPHHWQYWVLRQDDGRRFALEMPMKYRKEMLADWRGTGRAIHGKDDTYSWYHSNKWNIILGVETRKWIEREISRGYWGTKHG